MPVRKIENPDSFRENIRKKLEDFFGPDGKKHAINLEKGVHNWALKEATSKKVVKKWDNPFFVQIYLDHLRSIYINLKNEKLIKLVSNGEMKAHEIAFMTHQEMNPEAWRKLIDEKIKRDANKYSNNTQASTDMFTCKKCRGKRCTYYELQTRSADEPATIFVTCLDCGKNWKT